jgi:hypothetical protein
MLPWADVPACAGIDFAVCGGLAVYARGGVPTDHDVDFLIRPQHVDVALTAMREAGLRTERPAEGWLVP